MYPLLPPDCEIIPIVNYVELQITRPPRERPRKERIRVGEVRSISVPASLFYE